MKKISILIIIITMLFSALSCMDNRKIKIWSYDEEAANMLKIYDVIAKEPLRYSYSYTAFEEQFEKRLDPVFQKGRGAPDIFIFNDSSVRKYVESGKLLDLTYIYLTHKDKFIPYAAEIGTHQDSVYALSWNAAPAAFFYRRSLARKYLGIDDPEAVETYISDINKFIETADMINRMSDGRAIILSSYSDLFYAFLAERNNPWIVEGKLQIDPEMIKYMETGKLFFEKGYDAKVERGGDGWRAGLYDRMQNPNGEPYEVLGYFLSKNEFDNILNRKDAATFGDWAMVKGPAAYYQGGSWIGAWAETTKLDEVKKLIEWFLTDETFLLANAIIQNNIIVNTDVSNRITPVFSEPFLGGQNYYEAFSDIAKYISGKNIQSTDGIINLLFMEAANAYARDEMTMEEALAYFREKVSEEIEFN